MLSCSDCLARHSEYLDGAMDAATAEIWRHHIATCSRCARYDRVLRRGLQTLAKQAPLVPGSDFMLQLQQRLVAEDRRAVMRPFSSLAAASLAVAAMLALAASLPILMLATDEERADVAAIESAPTSAMATEIAWHSEDAVEARMPAHFHLARRSAWQPRAAGHVIEARYTPVVLELPTAPLNTSRVYLTGAE